MPKKVVFPSTSTVNTPSSISLTDKNNWHIEKININIEHGYSTDKFPVELTIKLKGQNIDHIKKSKSLISDCVLDAMEKYDIQAYVAVTDNEEVAKRIAEEDDEKTIELLKKELKKKL